MYRRVEVIEEGTEELEMLQALNILLSKCLSTRVQKAMVRYEQLPEWQKKSPPRLPDPIQLIACQTKKLNEKSDS